MIDINKIKVGQKIIFAYFDIKLKKVIIEKGKVVNKRIDIFYFKPKNGNERAGGLWEAKNLYFKNYSDASKEIIQELFLYNFVWE